MIDLYNGYTTDDVLRDIPFEGKSLILYPVKVYQEKQFNRLLQYILYSRKHYGIDRKVELLSYVIQINGAYYLEINKKLSNDEAIGLVIKDLEELFTIICRQNIKFNIDEDNKICFTNKEKTIQITNKNFNLLRIVVLKQNAIHEPKIFKNEIEKELTEEWLKRQEEKRKGNSIEGMGEKMNLITCSTSKTYESLENENILQFNCDYLRCCNNMNFIITSMFRTVSDKVSIINYTDEVLSHLYADPYKGMEQDLGSFLGSL